MTTRKHIERIATDLEDAIETVIEFVKVVNT